MGDPLNPIVPILPTMPTPPDSVPIRRIEREQQREAAPDWQTPEDDSKDEREQQFDDDYDPDWGKWNTLEPVSGDQPISGADEAWDPGLGHDRRADDRSSDDDDERPGPHIDITA
ncbi:MAG TPA: hypothetical protein VHV75_08950 [Solirubrobacteraceae bacterium]|jgi:hypothetical protein|nr:hypothetical protein [Solirubrobacteraceae bacterium]